MREERRRDRPTEPHVLARAALAAPHLSAVYLVGPPGSGKSFLLEQLIRPDGNAAPPAHARAGGRMPPPLAVRAGGVDDTGTSALLALLADVATERGDGSGDAATRELRPPRLVAIDDIDRLAASVLTALARAIDGHRVRLLATVRTDAASEVLGCLRVLGGTTLVTIPPWQRKDVASLMEQRLGGPVHGLTVARLTRLSGGNPLCVRESLDLGIATGALRRVYDVWQWEGGLRVPPVTAARIGGGLPKLAPDAQDVLDAISFAGTLPLDLVESTFSAAAVEQADDAAVLHVWPRDDRLMVASRSGIESRVIAAGLSRTRRRRLTQALLAALETSGEAEVAATLELAELDWLADAAPSRTLAQAAADAAQARHQPTLAAQLRRLHAGPEQPRQPQLSPRMAEALLRGQVGEALDVLTGQDGPLTPDDEAWMLMLAGVAQLASGRLAEARGRAQGLLRRGAGEDWPLAYQLGALLAGRCALATGDMHLARLRFAEAATCPVMPDMAMVVPTALTHLALALAALGRLDESEDTLASATRHRATRLSGLSDFDDITAAEIMLEIGLHHAAAEAALVVADRCEPIGQVLPAVMALHLCARARPTREVAERLGALVADTDLGLAPVFHQFAKAAACRDAAGVADAATQLEGLGLHRLAGEAASAALSLTSPPRTAPWVSGCRRMLNRLRSASDATIPTWWWQGDEQSTVLTDREREIAELAASGWSTPQIAAHLQLSRRTVENHLQHSYRKLGVTRRQELATALGRPRQTQTREWSVPRPRPGPTS